LLGRDHPLVILEDRPERRGAARAAPAVVPDREPSGDQEPAAQQHHGPDDAEADRDGPQDRRALRMRLAPVFGGHLAGLSVK
jgi:hypothetical protein